MKMCKEIEFCRSLKTTGLRNLTQQKQVYAGLYIQFSGKYWLSIGKGDFESSWIVLSSSLRNFHPVLAKRHLQ